MSLVLDLLSWMIYWSVRSFGVALALVPPYCLLLVLLYVS